MSGSWVCCVWLLCFDGVCCEFSCLGVCDCLLCGCDAIFCWVSWFLGLLLVLVCFLILVWFFILGLLLVLVCWLTAGFWGWLLTLVV